MDTALFNALLPLRIQGLVEELRKQHPSLSLQDVLHQLYTSQTYALLEQEATKFWHYSPCMLAEMLRVEQETGNVFFPDLV
jgi:hypothetical protein